MFWRRSNRRPFPSHLHVVIVAAKFPGLSGRGEHGFLWPVARGLVRLGHRVSVLCWGTPDQDEEFSQDGVKVYSVGGGRSLNLSAFPELVLHKFEDLYEQDPVDVVHSIDHGAWAIAEIKDEFGVAVAFDVEATQLSQIFAILGMAQESFPSLVSTAINVVYKFLTTYFGRDRRILARADAMFVTSPPQRLALERYYLYPEMKTHLVPYGIEISDLSPREKSEELRKKLNLPENGQVIVTVTDMTELAETQHLLRAFERIAVKRPNARLLIVGNGPLFKQIEYEMLCLALGSRVIFTGAVPGNLVADYISLADIFVSLSARTSGFEPSLLEAMAQKKTIIGSEVSPIAALVEDGLDGFLIRPADINSLADLLHQIFNGEVDHTSLGERAREKVTRLFDSNRMVQQTLTAYHEAMRASGFFARPVALKVLAKDPSAAAP